MARWINVRQAFDYHWPGRSAVTAFREPGDYMVKDEVADFAVQRGYAKKGKADDSSRSTKGKRARRSKREKPDAANARAVAPVGDESAADADRAADRPAVDRDPG